MEYKAAICDDEALELVYLSELVQNWAKERGHRVRIFLFPSAEAFLFQYEEEKDFDLLLLDIEMGKMNGVELARKVRRENTGIQILFVTAYPDFIFEGYEVSALHYLMKPLKEEKLFQVLERAAANLDKKERYEIFQREGESIRIPVSEIVSVEAFSHSVQMVTKGGSYRLDETISGLEERLGDGFVRCHRSYLVSLKYIQKITRTDVEMDTGDKIPLSRRKYDVVNQAFIRYYRQEEENT